MIIGAMQSHFMPGIGYFALMKNVDQFVILDDVQFEKEDGSKEIIFLNKKNFLTAPFYSGLFHQKINKVKISKGQILSQNILELLSKCKKQIFLMIFF